MPDIHDCDLRNFTFQEDGLMTCTHGHTFGPGTPTYTYEEDNVLMTWEVGDPQPAADAFHLLGNLIDPAAFHRLTAAIKQLDTLTPASTHEEPTMHVTDLNGTHLGKTITVCTEEQTLTGVLWRVQHEAQRHTTRATGAACETTDLTHSIKVGVFIGYIPGHANVEVHP